MAKQEFDVCPRCNGAGRIAKPQWIYSISPTAEERRKLLGAMPCVASRPLLAAEQVQFVGVSGAAISEACTAAKEFAAEYDVACAFEFNNQLVIVRADSVVAELVTAWYRAAYGKTPEEVHAER